MAPRALALLLAAAIVAAAPAGAQQPQRARRAVPPPAPRIPTPRSVLGFEPGEDRKLADWPTLLRYYQALARASDRVATALTAAVRISVTEEASRIAVGWPVSPSNSVTVP